jgi:hypothetical protein
MYFDPEYDTIDLRFIGTNMTKLKASPVPENTIKMSSEKKMILAMMEQLKQVEKKNVLYKKQALS